jgi:hypothetical protein
MLMMMEASEGRNTEKWRKTPITAFSDLLQRVFHLKRKEDEWKVKRWKLTNY